MKPGTDNQNDLALKRKHRAKRALSLARFVKIGLVITIGLTVRADAQLRSVLWSAGTDTLARLADPQSDPRVRHSLAGPLTRSENGLPDARVKVNRPSKSTENLQIDAQAVAREVTATLERLAPN